MADEPQANTDVTEPSSSNDQNTDLSQTVTASAPAEATPEPQTAQMVGNEPLATEEQTDTEQVANEVKSEPAPQSIPSAQLQTTPSSLKTFALSLLAKANALIQFRKRKKLEKIMTLLLKKPQIKNDEVEKLLHVFDATATRYLSQLEKEGRIRQVGKTGKGVSYSKL